jgi:hypothetical protein
MKKVTIKARNTARKTILNLGFASMFLFGLIPTTLKAQDKDKPDTVAINYIGMLDEKPLFQIEFDNKEGVAYRVSITDESGETLYSEKFSDKKFSRKFKLESPELSQSKLTFTITSEKEKHTQTFVINSNFRTVPDYVITRL